MLFVAPHRAALLLLLVASALVACASSGDADADGGGACATCGGDDSTADAANQQHDSATAIDAGNRDSATTLDGHAGDATSTDSSAGDTGSFDSSANDVGSVDSAAMDAGAHDTGTVSIITGGPCLSGAAGATAYRVHWIDAGGQAQVVYDVDGLPDRSRDHTEAYGYQIGFTSQFVDPFLGDGGLQLDSDDFVDIEISTAGLSSIANATISIFGRSFDTTTNGSFNWQTFLGTGASPTDLVSNIAPYRWYSADFTTEISAGDNGVLIRVKAGPSSGVLVVNRLEICMQAQ